MTLSVRFVHRLGAFALDVAFEAPPGITVLFGRSGSGKTTIVNAVAGLLRPREGRIALDGDVLSDSGTGTFVPVHRRRIGYVFQEARLFPHLTVRRNLGFGRWFSVRRRDAPEFDRVVGMLGLGPLLGRSPGALSGGERQRVALGRALLAEPRLILADEPLAALDEARKAEILPYLETLRDEVSVPILYVSHAVAEVARLATTVVALENGRVTGQGPAAHVLSDPMLLPAGVWAAGSILSARLVAHHDDGLSELDAGGIALFLPRIGQLPGTALRIRIAAQEVILSRDPPRGLSALNVLPGTIHAIRAGEGPGAIVALDTPAGRILARVTRRSVAALGLSEGAACHAVVKAIAIAPQDVGG